MKTIILKVQVPDATDENAITINHHVRPYPIACRYEILQPPTDECEWTILSMNIGTQCGEMTERNSDSEDYKYCPYCGGKIKRV